MSRRLGIPAILLSSGAVAAVAVLSAVGLRAGPDASAGSVGHARHLAVPLHAGLPSAHLPPPVRLGGTVIPNRSGPSTVPVAANVDGCDHDYGKPDQCVPWSIPGSGTAAKCAWLSTHGFGTLKVYGKDRQHLEQDKDGKTCAKA